MRAADWAATRRGWSRGPASGGVGVVGSILVVLMLTGWSNPVLATPPASLGPGHSQSSGDRSVLPVSVPKATAAGNGRYMQSPATGYRPVTPSNNYQGFCIPMIENVYLNFSSSGLSLDLSWVVNRSASYSFHYGTSQPPTSSQSAGGGVVKLVNLTATTTYYYSVKYTSTIPQCNSYPHQGWYNQSFATGTGQSGGDGYTAGKCPVSYVIVDVTPHPSATGGKVSISWVNYTGPNAPVAGFLATLQLFQGTNLLDTVTAPPTDPYNFSGLSSVYYTIRVTANPEGSLAACIATGYGQATFFGGCVNTVVQGVVAWGGSTIPIYGAAMIVNSSGNSPWTYVTDVSGSYYWSDGCVGANNVQVTTVALGFAYSSRSYTSLTAHTTTWYNASLTPISTDGNSTVNRAGTTHESQYDLDALVPHASNTLPTINYSIQGGVHYVSPTVSWAATGGAGEPPLAPDPSNPDGKVLELTGTDSSVTNELADVFFDMPAPTPFGGLPQYRPSVDSPMYFEFDVYIPTNSFSARFLVDAVFSNHLLISNVTDNLGNTIHDTSGLPCTASALQYQLGVWNTEECDLSALGNLEITDFLFEYVNLAGGGGGNTFTAFFDAPRLVNAVDPIGIANGGFETPSEVDGWVQGGLASLVSTPVPTGLPPMDDGGTQYVLLGEPPSSVCGSIRCPQTSMIYQVFRLPSGSGTQWYGSVNISMNLSMGNACTPAAKCTESSGDSSSFSITLQDLTTGIAYVIEAGNGSVIHAWGSTSFQAVSFNVTFLLGHLLKLVLSVASGYYFSSQPPSGYTADHAWLSADAVRVAYPFEKFIAESGAASSATLRLFGSQYWLPTCNSGPQGVLDIGQSVSGVSTTSIHNFSWDTNDSGYVTTDVQANASAGIDVYGVNEDCGTSNYALLRFTAHGEANATGYVTQAAGASTSCPPGSSCADYVMLAALFLTVTETYDSGTALPSLSAWPLEPAPFSANAAGIVNTHNLTVTTPGPYDWLTQDQAETITETIAFVGLSLLVTGGVAALDLPIVFTAAIGVAEIVAEGALHLTLFDKLFADYNPVGTNDCSTAQGNTSSEWLQCYGVASKNASSYNITTMADMTLGLEAPVGAVHGGTGGSYTLSVQVQGDYCYYVGNTGDTCGQNPILVYPIATATLLVDTY